MKLIGLLIVLGIPLLGLVIYFIRKKRDKGDEIHYEPGFEIPEEEKGHKKDKKKKK